MTHARMRPAPGPQARRDVSFDAHIHLPKIDPVQPEFSNRPPGGPDRHRLRAISSFMISLVPP